MLVFVHVEYLHTTLRPAKRIHSIKIPKATPIGLFEQYNCGLQASRHGELRNLPERAHPLIVLPLQERGQGVFIEHVAMVCEEVHQLEPLGGHRSDLGALNG